MIGPVDVWHFDNPILNTSNVAARTEYDFFIRLNQGQTVNIEGQVNNLERSDSYVITAGPGVTGFQIILTWGTGADADLFAYRRSPHTFIAQSIDSFGGREPQSGTFDVPVDELVQYLIEAYTFIGTGGQGTGGLGGPYNLQIQAFP